MIDMIVVGGGIMGITIADWLTQKLDMDVRVFDYGDPMAGTPPSGGSVKPSKLTGLDDEQLKPALKVLDGVYGLTKETFTIRPSGGLLKADVYQIPVELVVNAVKYPYKVTSIVQGTPHIVVYEGKHGEKMTVKCRRVVVAAGMGCAFLLPSVFGKGELSAKRGVSFRFEGNIDKPFVQAWAPYKQITVHNIEQDGEFQIWGSDGSALKPESWTDQRTAECLGRVQNALGAKHKVLKTITGYRSFHGKSKPCFLKELAPGFWVATGAGKFGCIAAGWAAEQIYKTIQEG